ncbi:MAG: energy transducer TonB [Kiritimatiellae bacterium]|nr:energy transducer TonB [Kiritimatiellia bacterium]
MTRYAVALFLAILLHAAAFWGWCVFRQVHPDQTTLPAIDLSSVELSFSDTEDADTVHVAETQPAPPAAPQPTSVVPPKPVLPPPEVAPQESSDAPVETPPDVLMEPDGLPIPVAPPPNPTNRPPELPPQDTAKAEPAKSATAAPEPARETAHIQAPPAPPSSFRPKYPTNCRRRGEEGVVSLEIDVNVLGQAIDVRILISSGFPDLDEAAVKAAKKARFAPATQDGKAVPGRIRLPVEFKLK